MISFRSGLPKGKTWYKQSGALASGGITGLVTQLVNPVEPSTLAALVQKGKRGKSGYSGTITFKQLGKVSRSLRASKPIFATPDTDITYDLTLDGKGLPSRLSTSWEATGPAAAGGADRTYKVETRYRSWGAKVSIKPPPAAKTSSKLTR